MQLTLGPADSIHEDVVLMGFVLVMLELPLQVLQLFTGKLPRILGLAGKQTERRLKSSGRATDILWMQKNDEAWWVKKDQC